MIPAQSIEVPKTVMEKVGPNIISHVSNSSKGDHSIINFPVEIFGIDFSVTKHVLMLWLVAALLSVLVIIPVRRFLNSGKIVPSGWVNAIEAIVKFIRDSIVQPNVGDKWVMTWTPVILTFFFFILFAFLLCSFCVPFVFLLCSFRVPFAFLLGAFFRFFFRFFCVPFALFLHSFCVHLRSFYVPFASFTI